MPDNKYKSLAKDTGIFAIGNFGTKILSFLCVSLYTAYLTTSEFGEADALITTITLLLPVFSLELSEAVLRFLYDEGVDKKQIYSISAFASGFAIILAILGMILASILSPSLQEYSFYFIFIFLFSTVEAFLSSITKGIGKIKCFVIKGLIFTSVFIASNIVLLIFLHKGLEGYFVSYIFAYATSCVYMYFAVKMYKHRLTLRINRLLLKQMLVYSIPFIPASISWWINSSADKYMLIWMIGSESNGLYSVAQKIPIMVTAVTTIFTQAWQLSAMQNYEESDFSDYFSEMFRLLASLVMFGTVAVMLVNFPVAKLLFQKDFFEAWKYVPMLTVACTFSTMAGFLASAFTSAKKTSALFISTCIGAVINIIVNYVLIIAIGAFGAAVATAISFIVVVICRIISMKNMVLLKIDYFKMVLSSTLIFGAALVEPYLKILPYYILSSCVAIAIVVINFKDFVAVLKTIKYKLLGK